MMRDANRRGVRARLPLGVHGRYECDVQLGDVIVVASDGLWDNLYEREIITTVVDGKDVNARPRSKSAAEHIAMRLAQEASKASASAERDTPWSEALTAEYVPQWQKSMGRKETGGKVDDITILVGIVQPAAVPAGAKR